MQEKFNSLIENILRDLSGGPLLLAVSGGVDSMCMAELFLRSGKCRFAVAHCNFHLRGEESDGDEKLVSDWAQANGVVCHKKDFDTLSYVSDNSVSIEMAARELRYGWFLSLCREFGYAAVAVAHHANDNAETLILNLLRGTGVKGITGMRRMSRIPVVSAGEKDLLLRPMLDFTREEIATYVIKHSVPYRQDSTNAADDCRRNLIRNRIFPMMWKLNPSFVSTLNTDMEHFAEADAVLDDWYSEWKARVTEGDDIILERLLAAPHRDYLLYRLLSERGFNSSVIRDVSRLVSSGTAFGGRKFLAGRYALVSSRGRLRFSLQAESPDDVHAEVTGDGVYELGSVRISVVTEDYDSSMRLKLPPGMIVFDAARLPFPFRVRMWNAGDWFRPLGMRGRKKISDFFTDNGVSVTDKEKTVVLLASGEESHVAALPGFGRIDDGLKVTPSTLKVVTVRIL